MVGMHDGISRVNFAINRTDVVSPEVPPPPTRPPPDQITPQQPLTGGARLWPVQRPPNVGPADRSAVDALASGRSLAECGSALCHHTVRT